MPVPAVQVVQPRLLLASTGLSLKLLGLQLIKSVMSQAMNVPTSPFWFAHATAATWKRIWTGMHSITRMIILIVLISWRQSGTYDRCVALLRGELSELLWSRSLIILSLRLIQPQLDFKIHSCRNFPARRSMHCDHLIHQFGFMEYFIFPVQKKIHKFIRRRRNWWIPRCHPRAPYPHASLMIDRTPAFSGSSSGISWF